MLLADVSMQLVVIGALSGLAYAVLAAGLVLIYRASGIINFAHGQIGALCGALLAKVVLDWSWPYLVAFPLMVALGGLLGGAVELGVIRRLFHAPRLILLVATIGVAQLLLFLEFTLVKIDNSDFYPSPIDRSVDLGGLLVLGQHFMLIAVVPAIICGLTIFLARTPTGRAIRAAAANADAARLAGISAKRVSTLVWVLAGSLSAVTAILLNPVRGVIPGQVTEALGPGLLLRALTAALVGRMVSLPWALVGGLVVGISEALLFANYGAGAVDIVLFLAVLVLVMVTRSQGDDSEGGSFSLAPRIRPIPAAMRAVPWVANLGRIGMGVGAVVAVLLPVVFSDAGQVFLFSRVLVFALMALSLTVLTGWAGQLSLGQFAFVGVGAFSTAALVDRGAPFAIAVIWATMAGVLVALAVGAPALRIRGLFLAVTTLAFAVAAGSWLFEREIFLGDSTVVHVDRPVLGPIDFGPQRTYYYLCLVVLALAMASVSRLRRSGIGRTLVAVRENERSAAACTVSPTRAKLTAFAISGALAALAGGLLAGLLPGFGPEAFGPAESLRIAAMTIIGGVGSVSGSVLGAVYVIGVPALFPDVPGIGVLTSGAGLLVLLLYLPGGLAGGLIQVRDLLVAGAARRLDAQTPASDGDAVPTPRGPHPAARPTAPSAIADPARRELDELAVGRPTLATHGVTVTFGGRVAVDNVTIEVARGEIVGLIGSNGAGKSTLMNAVSGFVPHTGSIEILGVDATALAPHDRARLGLGRAFQSARLFGDLTVTETIQVALERGAPSELVPSALALPPSREAERTKRARADELVDFLGLGRYAGAFIGELSTGTRRIVELATLLALEAQVLLLDEPTAGVAQREVEAFGPLIVRIQRDLGATVVLIEHDIPLVMSMSDRVYCLEAGSVIAEGPPQAVRDDPRVIASYLGTDDRAILRSDSATAGVGR